MRKKTPWTTQVRWLPLLSYPLCRGTELPQRASIANPANRLGVEAATASPQFGRRLTSGSCPEPPDRLPLPVDVRGGEGFMDWRALSRDPFRLDSPGVLPCLGAVGFRCGFPPGAAAVGDATTAAAEESAPTAIAVKGGFGQASLGSRRTARLRGCGISGTTPVRPYRPVWGAVRGGRLSRIWCRG